MGDKDLQVMRVFLRKTSLAHKQKESRGPSVWTISGNPLSPWHVNLSVRRKGVIFSGFTQGDSLITAPRVSGFQPSNFPFSNSRDFGLTPPFAHFFASLTIPKKTKTKKPKKPPSPNAPERRQCRGSCSRGWSPQSPPTRSEPPEPRASGRRALDVPTKKIRPPPGVDFVHRQP